MALSLSLSLSSCSLSLRLLLPISQSTTLSLSMGCALACKLAWLGCLAWAGVILAGEKNEESIFQGGDSGTGEQKERILHVVLILFSFLFSLFYPSVFIPLFLQFFIL
ncbi:hypothetical protein K457DRAFT_666634 [Linnemannia elongata AG-77]|uniref:Uncharacterized protein n=1 Tax=Linnemannia elongata AG-77 TaxID=1314771 RepID=A0A197JRP6_9FUNG|nr:hypothetical protein K457DRAFT_666634 [Linnemannia elongata AG-77]